MDKNSFPELLVNLELGHIVTVLEENLLKVPTFPENCPSTHSTGNPRIPTPRLQKQAVRQAGQSDTTLRDSVMGHITHGLKLS